MPIDFTNEKHERLSISERTFMALDSSQDVLEQKTGIRIDQYGRTVLYPNHAKLWLLSIQDFIAVAKNLAPSVKTECSMLIKYLHSCIEQKTAVFINGE